MHLRAPKNGGVLIPSAIAAVAAFVVVLSFLHLSHNDMLPKGQMVTATGETRTVDFRDGTHIMLNTRTRLKSLGGISQRTVELYDGEAFFDIAPGRNRPFRVLVEKCEIRVLGTRFNVKRRKDGRVTVSVLDGSVEVRQRFPASSRVLHKNEKVTFRPGDAIEDVKITDTSADALWLEGRLRGDAPLSELIEELERYTDARIRIRPDALTSKNTALADEKTTGTFDLRDIPGELEEIERELQTNHPQKNGAPIIEYREAGPH